MNRSVAASVAGLLILASFLGSMFREDPREFSTTSYGTLPGGFGALHDWLRELDLPVRRSFVGPEALPSDATVWWIEPDSLCERLADDDWQGPFVSWVRGGGTAVFFSRSWTHCDVGLAVGPWTFPTGLPEPEAPPAEPAASGAGPIDSDPAEDAPTSVVGDARPPPKLRGPLVGVERTLPVPVTVFPRVPEGFDVVARVDGAPFALEAGLGTGRVVLVADAALLQNQWLDAADGPLVAFAWVTAYGTPWLDEKEHGFADQPGTLATLASSPAMPVFAGLAVCGILFAWSGQRWRRREIEEFAADPPTLASYVDSLATLFSRVGDHDEVFERYREYGLAELRRALALEHDAGPDRVVAALRGRAEVDASDLEVLLGTDSVAHERDLEAGARRIDRLIESAR